MRALIYLLAIGNLVLFALAGGWFGNAPASSVAPAEALSPDRIQIVSKGDPPERSVAPVPQFVCIEWPDVSGSQADRIAAASEASGLLPNRQIIVAEKRQWSVSIPPSPTGKVGAEKKAAELKKLGIKDFLVQLEEGSNRYALLFGTFSTETEADFVLSQLRKKGVRSAQMTSVVVQESSEKVVLRGGSDLVSGLRGVLPASVSKDCDESTMLKAPSLPNGLPAGEKIGEPLKVEPSGTEGAPPVPGPPSASTDFVRKP